MTETRSQDAWVFGYASLLWSPGFTYSEIQPARVFGYHRALCVYSHIYRGTKERPGLVAGLLPGGSCHGLAFRIAAADWNAVRDYLHEREMVYNVYVPKWVSARIGLEPAQVSDVYTFIANPLHEQYAGRLSLEDTALLIRNGHGISGSGTDYLANTVARLAELGIRDRAFERILAAVKTNAVS